MNDKSGVVQKLIDVIIVGGGKVGIRLIELLKKQENYGITLIDNHMEVINTIKEEFDDVNIINGDATNRKILQKAGIETADIIVAATSIDEVNRAADLAKEELEDSAEDDEDFDETDDVLDEILGEFADDEYDYAEEEDSFDDIADEE